MNVIVQMLPQCRTAASLPHWHCGSGLVMQNLTCQSHGRISPLFFYAKKSLLDNLSPLCCFHLVFLGMWVLLEFFCRTRTAFHLLGRRNWLHYLEEKQKLAGISLISRKWTFYVQTSMERYIIAFKSQVTENSGLKYHESLVYFPL